MKILTQNVKLYFECVNDNEDKCPTPQKTISDPYELTLPGVPICSVCNEEMVISDECLITN